MGHRENALAHLPVTGVNYSEAAAYLDILSFFIMVSFFISSFFIMASFFISYFFLMVPFFMVSFFIMASEAQPATRKRATNAARILDIIESPNGIELRLSAPHCGASMISMPV